MDISSSRKAFYVPLRGDNMKRPSSEHFYNIEHDIGSYWNKSVSVWTKRTNHKAGTFLLSVSGVLFFFRVMILKFVA